MDPDHARQTGPMALSQQIPKLSLTPSYKTFPHFIPIPSSNSHSFSIHHKHFLKHLQVLTELANFQSPLSDSGNGNVVLTLYHALSTRDVKTVSKLLAHDLEWWFHGPPSHQYMMQLLTGTENNKITNTFDSFQFIPLSIDEFGSTVIVEGCDKKRDIYWIHAWTVNSFGIITQVREYFNTSLTVTRFLANSKETIKVSAVKSLHCPSVWESSLTKSVGKSVPGLVLAI
uniref:uncharacterized protein LOC122589015 n=1 Tax=Erigeron canadensis TaxID=72917 RepID=UPI001CB8FBD7|nr:uncharacterized protein LOC122589015 [Erigeron canadensis]